jgi:hypothetical protein
MCTVTLVPQPDSLTGFILTSNRDEAVGRETLPPSWERYNNVKLYFPKDKQAGGTWLGVSELCRCICLMNGGEQPHVREHSYRKSRGVVVKDFLSAPKLRDYRKTYDYDGIEPFTMIIVEWHNGLSFQELIWDGNEVKFSTLPIKENIWSSSPLYTQKMKAERKDWFDELKGIGGYTEENLLDFHYSAGEGNKNYGLIIDRGFLKTQSISQVVNHEKELKFTYENLLDKGKQQERLFN